MRTIFQLHLFIPPIAFAVVAAFFFYSPQASAGFERPPTPKEWAKDACGEDYQHIFLLEWSSAGLSKRDRVFVSNNRNDARHFLSARILTRVDATPSFVFTATGSEKADSTFDPDRERPTIICRDGALVGVEQS